MSQTVQTFQLGTSTVVTLPKKLGIKPGQKLEIKKTRQGVSLKLGKKEGLLEVLERARGVFKDEDWEDYQKRRKLEIEATKRLKKVW